MVRYMYTTLSLSNCPKFAQSHRAWSSLPRSVLSTANPTSLLLLACVHVPLALVEFTSRLEKVVTVMQAQPGCEALCALEKLP